MKFRETTPKRQNITKEVSDYHEHKINLQKNFSWALWILQR